MLSKTKNHIKDTMWSMKNAWSGIRAGFKNERNFRIEIVLAVAVIFLGIISDFSYLELALVFFVSGTILGAELLNTAIEETWNMLHPDRHETVGRIKDLASGGVLTIAIGAALFGFVVFLHHL